MALATERVGDQHDTESDFTDFAHTGPGTLAGRYLRLFWQPIYRSQDLRPGRAVPIQVMGEQFALYRGESGTPHLVAAHCAHRGTHLSVGWVEGDCIRCAYHGWVYDGAGQCVEQPAEDEGYARRVRIAGYPIQEYLGLIFAYFGEEEAPPLPRYPEFEEEGVIEVDGATRPYNYYQTLENGGDWVHVAFAHGKRIRDAEGRFRIPEMVAEETDWGYQVQLTYPGRPTQVVEYGLPNIHYHPKKVRLPRRLRKDTGVEWVDSLAWRAVPIDDASFNVFEVTLVRVTGDDARRYQQARAEAQEASAMTPSTAELARSVLAGARSFTDLEDLDEVQATRMGNVGDFVTQAAQGTIADRQHERLGRSDVAIVLLRKIWARELRALAEGRPVKRWERPDQMIVRAGPLEGY